MKNVSKVLWGIVLITIGMIFAVNALGIASIHLFRGWWTLFIIIPSFIGLFDKDDRGGSMIGLVIGIALLLSAQGLISFGSIIKLIVPFIIICIGVSVLLHGVFGDVYKDEAVKKMNKNRKSKREIEYATVMGADEREIKGTFKDCSIDTIFGSLILDLRKAKLDDETFIDISAIFGKVEIVLPEDVDVRINSTKVFGGVSSKTESVKTSKKKNDSKEKTIYIDAVAIFGGVEIR